MWRRLCAVGQQPRFENCSQPGAQLIPRSAGNTTQHNTTQHVQHTSELRIKTLSTSDLSPVYVPNTTYRRRWVLHETGRSFLIEFKFPILLPFNFEQFLPIIRFYPTLNAACTKGCYSSFTATSRSFIFKRAEQHFWSHNVGLLTSNQYRSWWTE